MTTTNSAGVLELKRGLRGTYAGFPAVFVRHYYENMIEILVPGGMTCVWIGHFIPEAE